MKINLIKLTLLFVLGMLFPTSLISQSATDISEVNIFPSNPKVSDSLYVTFTYVSGDACPDYYLKIDTISDRAVFVSKHKIETTRLCAEVITKFSVTLNLGILKEKTAVYFNNILIKTISYTCQYEKEGEIVAGINDCEGQLFISDLTSPVMSMLPQLYLIPNLNTTATLKVGDKVKFSGNPISSDSVGKIPCYVVGIATCYKVTSTTSDCIMEQKGEVVSYDNKASIIKDLTTGILYAIQNENLALGTIVMFKGTVIQCFTTPCYSIVECYKVILTPPNPCVMDKKGVVVYGNTGCSEQLFIQEYSPISAYKVLYSIESMVDNTMKIALQAGDEVNFGGYLIRNDSIIENLCRISGIATCYELTSKVGCEMTQKGEVVANKENACLVKDITTGLIYAIYDNQFSIGTIVVFKGSKVVCKTVPCYNIVDCYKVVLIPPVACPLDQKGVVVSGIEGCPNQLLIKSFSDDNLTNPHYYTFKANLFDASGSLITALKVGDFVKFSGFLIVNDSSLVKNCMYTGIATCYELLQEPVCEMNKKGEVIEIRNSGSIVKDISTSELYEIKNVQLSIGTIIAFKGIKIECFTTPCYSYVECYKIIVLPPSTCVKDKKGIIVEGIDGCTGRLFIKEIASTSTLPRLYIFKNNVITADGTVTTALKPGDKVIFGAYLFQNDSLTNILCSPVGEATCFELLSVESKYALMGKAIAGNDLMKTGIAYLFRKGYDKALSANTITDGTFEFNGLPQANYTIYVVPDISNYKNYLPTFYPDKFLYGKAVYLNLNQDIKNIVVQLNSFNLKMGSGRISGNVFFNSNSLKDSVMNYSSTSSSTITDFSNTAINVPVTLLNSVGEAVAWTMTDDYGNYVFESLPYDTYTIVSETATAKAELTIEITSDSSSANVDLILKSNLEKTELNKIHDNVVNIYPNPVINTLRIILKEKSNFYLINTLGQKLMEKSLHSGLNEIDLSEFKEGLYLLDINKSTFKIIKK